MPVVKYGQAQAFELLSGCLDWTYVNSGSPSLFMLMVDAIRPHCARAQVSMLAPMSMLIFMSIAGISLKHPL